MDAQLVAAWTAELGVASARHACHGYCATCYERAELERKLRWCKLPVPYPLPMSLALEAVQRGFAPAATLPMSVLSGLSRQA
jgi:hypothetical protein